LQGCFFREEQAPWISARRCGTHNLFARRRGNKIIADREHGFAADGSRTDPSDMALQKSFRERGVIVDLKNTVGLMGAAARFWLAGGRRRDGRRGRRNHGHIKQNYMIVGRAALTLAERRNKSGGDGPREQAEHMTRLLSAIFFGRCEARITGSSETLEGLFRGRRAFPL